MRSPLARRIVKAARAGAPGHGSREASVYPCPARDNPQLAVGPGLVGLYAPDRPAAGACPGERWVPGYLVLIQGQAEARGIR